MRPVGLNDRRGKWRCRCSTRFMNGAIMRANSAISAATSEEKISEEAIREELSHILESPMFIQSDRLSRFLRFTVEATLETR